MTTSPSFAATIPLNGNTFHLLREAIHARMGVYYADDQRDLLAIKLSPLVIESGFTNFLDYYYHLKYDNGTRDDWEKLITALAVNETYFWREYDQIRAAAQHIIPQWQRKHPGKPIRIWHAACASGEEPYTMAIALVEAGRYIYGPIDILASDINPKALEIAQRAIYRQRSFRAIPPEIKEKYFKPVEGQNYQLRDSIRRRVAFRRINLLNAEELQSMPEQHIIFCRNVFIYFSENVIRSVSNQFYQVLRPGGYLFLGAAESLLRINDHFDLVTQHGAIGYQKPAGG